MKVAILAGGRSSRFGSFKPLYPIAGMPMIFRVMEIYDYYGIRDFVIAGGYKFEELNRFFDDLFSGRYELVNCFPDCDLAENYYKSWKVSVIDTGQEGTPTGSRVLQLMDYITEPFHLTYSDGLGNVNLHKLLADHQQQKKIATITTVSPPRRFHRVLRDSEGICDLVSSPPHNTINGGFMFIEPAKIKGRIYGAYPFEATLATIANYSDLGEHVHEGWWMCADYQHEAEAISEHISSLYREGKESPWKHRLT